MLKFQQFYSIINWITFWVVEEMRVLCIGDVCGSIGCRTVSSLLPKLKREYNIDFTVVNGENSADGNGITPLSADMLFSAGADVITGGNHSLRRKEVYDLLDSNPFLLRPHNLSDTQFGKGYTTIDFGYTMAAVINLSGKVYLESQKALCPFATADKLIEQVLSDGAKIILVDFHAEATSEKRALGIYLDGKVSAVFGTHTHIQTNDAAVLKGGTGYITDLGMTGPEDSVLGVKSSIIIDRFTGKNTTEKFVLADGKCIFNGCVFDIDNKTGKTLSVETLYIKE